MALQIDQTRVKGGVYVEMEKSAKKGEK